VDRDVLPARAPSSRVGGLIDAGARFGGFSPSSLTEGRRQQTDCVRGGATSFTRCGYVTTVVLRLVRPGIEAPNFEIAVAHRDGLVNVKLGGEFDFFAQARYATTLAELVDHRSCVVVDLGDVDFIDSSGIGFLVKIAGAHDGPLRLVNVPDSIARLLHLTGLDEVFDYTSTSS
jgi:anti-anti-sigma factor